MQICVVGSLNGADRRAYLNRKLDGRRILPADDAVLVFGQMSPTFDASM